MKITFHSHNTDSIFSVHRQDNTISLKLEDIDIPALTTMFGDADTARAVWLEVVKAPDEIRIMLFIQYRIWQGICNTHN